ncbi:MAG: deoxyguanosinetriphosphate triphosphohydrolase [Chloroflexota bacterium]|nr:deoxyguanosinetriphosphate triphosphohydrolase [Chloroflexota bacterium]
MVPNVRERLEERERVWLAPAAAPAIDATRPAPETRCDLRTDFQRDRDRILHCKAFRRLKYKTQVFLSPSADHMRTRLTHTLEVTQIGRTIARALDLNEDLTEAIGLGHDLGHTPFGHAGERALAGVFLGFRHNQQSLRVVDHLERDGRGLNLTDQTRDGILRHSKPVETIAGEVAGTPATAEAQIVKIADGIAYINHDLDDAIRGGMLRLADLPVLAVQRLGDTHAKRINTLVTDVVERSRPNLQRPFDGTQVITMSQDVLEATDALRRFLFERVYEPINRQPTTQHAEHIVQALFTYYVDHSDRMPIVFAPAIAGESIERRVADIVCGMTDRYAIRCYEQLFMPRSEEL